MSQLENNVWVFVEQHNGKPSDVSLELLSKGRKLADAMKGKLISLVIGSEVKNVSLDKFSVTVLTNPSSSTIQTLIITQRLPTPEF